MNQADDHFSPIAKEYARGRFGYPLELYQTLAAQCPARELAWDCGCGSGQVACDLPKFFTQVIATDISEPLLALAPPDPRVVYRAAPADSSGLPSSSVDLITVAQAVHWFDLDRFWREVLRVLKPGGVLAIWGYTWPQVNEATNHVLGFLKQEIAPFWPARSVLLHRNYEALNPPLQELTLPAFELSAAWSLEDYLDHLRSWSAVRYYKEHQRRDIVEALLPEFRSVWPTATVNVRWPLVLRVFRKET